MLIALFTWSHNIYSEFQEAGSDVPVRRLAMGKGRAFSGKGVKKEMEFAGPFAEETNTKSFLGCYCALLA